MVHGYWKSEQALKAYAAIEYPYPEEQNDRNYDRFVAETPEQNNSHAHKNTRWIQALWRLQVNPGEEYLMFHEKLTRYNPLGDKRIFTRTSVGRYPVPEPRRQIVRDPNTGIESVKVKGVESNMPAYIYQATKENIEQFHKDCNDTASDRTKRTSYFVQKEGDRRITVMSYEDFRDGDFDELYQNSRIVARKDKSKDKDKDKDKARQEE